MSVRIENSFIPVHGVGEVTEKKLWRAGIHTWDDFDGSVVGETREQRINEFIATAEGHLDEGNTKFFHDIFPSQARWRIYENFADSTCFLDIESTGLDIYRDSVTVVSLQTGEETTSLVREMNLTRDRLVEEFSEADLLVTYNGKQFDVPFLERDFNISIDLPHIDLRYPCQRLNLTGGLKEVENELDIPRSHTDIDGWKAVRLWYKYKKGDVDALNTLVAYNREDTQNLKTLMERVTSRLHSEVFISGKGTTTPR